MFFQGSVIASIASTNRDFFGPAQFVMLRHGVVDVYVFPLSERGDEEEGNAALGFAVSRPYETEQLVKSIEKKLSEAVMAENS